MTSEPTTTPGAPGRASVEPFTHPTCIGCQEALTALRQLERAEEIDLLVTSLGTSSGRERAECLGVTSVPTGRIGDDYRILLRKSGLDEVLADLRPAIQP